MKRLSIIIVTYNSERDIYDCLNTIRQYNDLAEEELEVIVVDNNSRQPRTMFDRLRTLWPGIVLIENDRNGGYGQGNNVGIRRAQAPVIMVMNPDVRLIQPIFQSALAAFDAPRLGILGMKQMVTPTRKSSFSFGTTLMMNGYARTVLMSVCNRFDLFLPRWMYVDGSCFFIRRDMFIEAGLFDEDCFMYGEEDDINYRMKKTCHCRVAYDPTLRFVHLTEGRRPNIEYEKKRFESSAMLNAKKGYPRHLTLRNFRQANQLLLFQAYLRRKNSPEEYALRRGLREYYKNNQTTKTKKSLCKS